MNKRKYGFVFSLTGIFFLAFVACAWGDTSPVSPPAPGAAYTLGDFPLRISSEEHEGELLAEISGVLDHPFQTTTGVLADPLSWCEFLPLVFNIKSCTSDGGQNPERLNLYVGRKFFESPEEAVRLAYLFRVTTRTSDRFQVILSASEGPMGTRDYRIEMDAVPTEDGRTRIQMHSSFRPSLRSSVMTRTYLATAGREKVGFSVLRQDKDGIVYVGGMQGIVERNVMRYYLALRAFLDTLSMPGGEECFEARLEKWFDMTEKYPEQLHEMDKETYLEAKRQEREMQSQLQIRLNRTAQKADPRGEDT